ncbi:MAG: hypothetical protein U5K71_04395 [Gracilimonas sp.]|nr:hypothetical protein [Gracilimonas sp.]
MTAIKWTRASTSLRLVFMHNPYVDSTTSELKTDDLLHNIIRDFSSDTARHIKIPSQNPMTLHRLKVLPKIHLVDAGPYDYAGSNRKTTKIAILAAGRVNASTGTAFNE